MKGGKGRRDGRNRSKDGLTGRELWSRRGNESNTIFHTLPEVLTSDLQGGGIWVGSWKKGRTEQVMK